MALLRSSPRKEADMRTQGAKFLLISAMMALAVAACGQKPAAAFRTEPVTRGSVSETVSATGDVSALVTVSVGSQVSGIVDKLYVDFNSPVKKGQLLATLDPRLFQAAPQKADATLANVDQADVGKVHEGDDAKFTVDAFPGEVFDGRIRQLRQASTTTNNVVTYAAVVAADNPQGKLRQGMTAAVTIVSESRENVLRVPNAALRMHIDAKPSPSPIPLVASAQAATPGQPPADGKSGIVYKLVNGGPQAVRVRIGLADGQRTEVEGDLAEGNPVIVSGGGSSNANSNPSAAKAPQRGPRGPF